ncbi:phage scaffolding protein [Paenibacillus arenosi]|uniref:Phage scaffolding protein n=1 Tax=Paenibacillus arenosi TaxID=2774142 RepID=A0ABR9B3E8_9BACL|nr:phage scaffolding protein [Paenibacillus arenosi]MBD8499957.1 phage scaffolding protein [Paenibacillus arenosi]
MIVESIKMFLGEELALQVETALQGKGKEGKDVDLVVGNDGSYVPAEKFDAVTKGKASAEAALKAAAEALRAIGGSGDPSKIATDVIVAQGKLDELARNYQSELASIQRTAAIRMALAGKVHDTEDLINLIDMDKIELDEAGNVKQDLEEIIAPIRVAKPYLFIDQQPLNGLQGAVQLQGGSAQEIQIHGEQAGQLQSNPAMLNQDQLLNLTLPAIHGARPADPGITPNSQAANLTAVRAAMGLPTL